MSDALRHHIVPLSGSRQLATARHASRVYPAVRNELGVYIRLQLYDKFQDEEKFCVCHRRREFKVGNVILFIDFFLRCGIPVVCNTVYEENRPLTKTSHHT